MTSSPRSSTAPEARGDQRFVQAPHLTLGVMARAPVVGRCKTRLGAVIGAAAAARVYEAMLLDTLGSLAAIPARHVVLAAPEDDGVEALRAIAPADWDVVTQRGDGLGERLANAISDLSHEGVLTCLLDSDSPSLPFDLIRQRLERSSRAPRRVVLGPCEDGGYYLVGLTSPELAIFDGIPWSTDRVMTVTRERCATLGLEVEDLPSSFDVDDASSLARLAELLSKRPELAPRTAEVVGQLELSAAPTTSNLEGR